MRIYLHGNCQIRILHRHLSDALPDCEINSYEVFGSQIVSQLARYQDLVKTSDVIITQPIGAGYRGIEELTTAWMRKSAKSSSSFIVFPSLYFRGYHPTIHYLRLNGRDIEGFGMPYHDLTALLFISRGMPDAEIVNLLCSNDLYDRDFVRSEFEASLDEMRRREQDDSIDIRLSEWMYPLLGERQLFHSINHPSREIMAFVANVVLDRLGVAAQIPREGPDDLSSPHLPLSPAVSFHLGMRDPAPQNFVFHAGQTECIYSQKDYFERYIDLMSERLCFSLTQALTLNGETAHLFQRIRQAVDRHLR